MSFPEAIKGRGGVHPPLPALLLLLLLRWIMPSAVSDRSPRHRTVAIDVATDDLPFLVDDDDCPPPDGWRIQQLLRIDIDPPRRPRGSRDSPAPGPRPPAAASGSEAEEEEDVDVDLSLDALISACRMFSSESSVLYVRSRSTGREYTLTHLADDTERLVHSFSVIRGELYGLLLDLDKLFKGLDLDRETFVNLMGDLNEFAFGGDVGRRPWHVIDEVDDVGYYLSSVADLLARVKRHRTEEARRRAAESPGPER